MNEQILLAWWAGSTAAVIITGVIGMWLDTVRAVTGAYWYWALGTLSCVGSLIGILIVLIFS